MLRVFELTKGVSIGATGGAKWAKSPLSQVT